MSLRGPASLTSLRGSFLGSRPVKLARVPVQGSPAILALSSRPWLNYAYRGILQFTPLIFDALDYAWSFSAELCPEGLIGIVGNSLRIFTFPRLGQKVQQTVIDLSYTPRQLLTSPHSRLLYTVEADHRTFSPSAIQKTMSDMRMVEMEVDEEVLNLDPKEFGLPRAPAGQWASCVRVIDPVTVRMALVICGEPTDAPPLSRPRPCSRSTSSITRRHSRRPSSPSTRTRTRSSSSSALARTRHWRHERASRRTCTRTSCSRTAGNWSFCTRQKSTTSRRRSSRSRAGSSRVSARRCGCTTSARRSCCGRQRTRCVSLDRVPALPSLTPWLSQTFATMIMTLNTQGTRIIVGDAQESIYYAVYKAPENRLLVFADDISPRWTTASIMVDYETVAAGDKFGNFFVNRLPKGVSSDVDDDPTGAGIMHEKPYLMGAPHRTHLIAHYHVGDIITSLHKVSLVAGGRDLLLYTGLMGTVGVLIPFVSNEDVDFFTTLEMHLRSEAPSLCGTFGGSHSLERGCADLPFHRSRASRLPERVHARQGDGRRRLVRGVPGLADGEAGSDRGRARADGERGDQEARQCAGVGVVKRPRSSGAVLSVCLYSSS